MSSSIYVARFGFDSTTIIQYVECLFVCLFVSLFVSLCYLFVCLFVTWRSQRVVQCPQFDFN